jgi:SHAQKYF class myb-like DNA-binding protein
MIKFKTKKLRTKKLKRIQKIAKPKIKVEPKIEEEPKIVKKNIFFIYHEVKKKNRFKLEKESDQEDQKKKRVKFVVSNLELGRWSYEEHKRFVRSIVKYPNDWVKITKEVKTRSDVQIRAHCQKFFKKLKKCRSDQLGIDFTSDTIHNINDMIAHVRSVNDDYDLVKIFLYFPKLCEMQTENVDSEEDDNINIFEHLSNDNKKEIFQKDNNKTSKMNNRINENRNYNRQNININNINNPLNLYSNYIYTINYNIDITIMSYIYNQIILNSGFNLLLVNYLTNLSHIYINNN